MEYHGYRLLKSSCFELSRHEKYDLCEARKLMERLYVLTTENFLFSTFWKWETGFFF